jgi:hypothetical protein
MERMRFQSVLDAFEEDRFFIAGSSTKRNDVNVLESLGMNDRNGHSSEKSERDEALLSVIKPIILEGEGDSFKYAWRVYEINAMNIEVDPTFPFVPGEAHRRSVYTVARGGQSFLGCANLKSIAETLG